jgi:hypothetical protein
MPMTQLLEEAVELWPVIDRWPARQEIVDFEMAASESRCGGSAAIYMIVVKRPFTQAHLR